MSRSGQTFYRAHPSIHIFIASILAYTLPIQQLRLPISCNLYKLYCLIIKLEFRSVLESELGGLGREGNRSISFGPVDTSLEDSAQFVYVDGCGLEQLVSVASRCILVYALIEYWASGDNLKAVLGGLNERTIDTEIIGNDWGADAITHEMLTLQQTENLLRPILSLLTRRSKKRPKGSLDKATVKVVLLLTGTRYPILGRLLSKGPATSLHNRVSTTQRRPRAGILRKFSLQNFKYSTPTAMEPEISFLMTNLAGVKQGSKVLDPFCGSCAILLCARHVGAEKIVGMDANGDVLKNEEIDSNFKAFGLQPPDRLMIGNIFSSQDTSNLESSYYDAIVTDPPYDAKEKVRRPSLAGEHAEVEEVVRLGMVNEALINLASRVLKVGGRLSFFISRKQETSQSLDFSATDLFSFPVPQNLELNFFERQRFTDTFTRYLVLITKTREINC